MSGSAHSPSPGARPGLFQEIGWIVGRDLLRERRTLGVVTMSVLLASGVVAACALVGGELGRTLGPLIIVTTVQVVGLKGTPWLLIAGL